MTHKFSTQIAHHFIILSLIMYFLTIFFLFGNSRYIVEELNAAHFKFTIIYLNGLRHKLFRYKEYNNMNILDDPPTYHTSQIRS